MMNVALFYVASKGITRHFIWKSKALNWIPHNISNNNKIGMYSLLTKEPGHPTSYHDGLVRLSKVQAVILACFLFGTVMSAYSLLICYGMDPLWSLPLALKHCTHPEYVKIDTQPFYIVMRFTGAALGLGLGLSSDQRYVVLNTPRNFIRTILTIKGGILIGRMVAMIQMNRLSDKKQLKFEDVPRADWCHKQVYQLVGIVPDSDPGHQHSLHHHRPAASFSSHCILLKLEICIIGQYCTVH
ncbi:Glucose-6-phosphatase-like 2 [Homarus americanus]|uniref:Glucose-6-phosphatase-like 2 n=1 Tax=Homarus americanus TaxID=6706 RepID=A0A8J5JWZ2_HOMAM|nr:Glucose-6-phosphatase-like 2 [Homarus americanus]